MGRMGEMYYEQEQQAIQDGADLAAYEHDMSERNHAVSDLIDQLLEDRAINSAQACLLRWASGV